MKFQISETYPCWTTWTRIVEADTQDEAIALFNEGEGKSEDGPFLGDILDGYDITLEVEIVT